MFYEPRKKNHGLKHDPFKSCVVPRPIGWITSLDAQGNVNLAPYSFFNALSTDPPFVMFSNNGVLPRGAKDTILNIETTKEFVCNMATWDLRFEMSETSAPAPFGANEMTLTGLEAEPSALVKPPRVKAAPIHLECVHWKTIELPSSHPKVYNAMVIGEVIGVHIRDDVLTDGIVDIAKIKPVARLGYKDYAVVERPFTMLRPQEREKAAAPQAG
jgi:flavin reductase (DIM6/NTAB) family NADH-FMN oxidoreductase RutF